LIEIKGNDQRILIEPTLFRSTHEGFDEALGTLANSQLCYDQCIDRYGEGNNNPPNTRVITTRFNGANTEIIVAEVPNDGIVPLWSQRGWGVPEFQTEGSNHFQVRNDRNTERLYDEVLSDDYTTFFNCQ